ncbi:MAG TPA: cytosine permease, partial [Anaerovoracaceae bacterium]|nr:cytosine permease [Anaerovoracaceae bacterium]
KKHVVIVVGLIAIALGATGFVNNFVGFLSILGVTVPPVGGIIIADYFILHKGEYKFGKGTRYGYLSMTAVISWIVACLIGYFWSWGIATINSMAIALVLYLILEMAFKNNQDKKFIGGFHVEDEYGKTVKEA